jgi:ubiquinol-cytochrome c reductase cytochrome c1 subunit
MKKFLIAILALLPTLTFAGGKEVPLLSANVDIRDQEALVKGAQLYMNYCMGCHSMKYQRYERTFDDLGIPHDLGLANIVPTGEKVGSLMTNNMDIEDGAKWFGAAPPDLTLIARLKGSGTKGPDWIYTYLKSFYVDESRPFGVNNTVFPDVGMPHALIDLQGVPRYTTEQKMIDGEMKEVKVGIKATGGSMSASEYDEAVRNLVTFLVYIGEPSRIESEAIGEKVLIFLLVLLVLVFLLKKEYWKDVH